MCQIGSGFGSLLHENVAVRGMSKEDFVKTVGLGLSCRSDIGLGIRQQELGHERPECAFPLPSSILYFCLCCDNVVVGLIRFR